MPSLWLLAKQAWLRFHSPLIHHRLWLRGTLCQATNHLGWALARELQLIFFLWHHSAQDWVICPGHSKGGLLAPFLGFLSILCISQSPRNVRLFQEVPHHTQPPWQPHDGLAGHSEMPEISWASLKSMNNFVDSLWLAWEGILIHPSFEGMRKKGEGKKRKNNIPNFN